MVPTVKVKVWESRDFVGLNALLLEESMYTMSVWLVTGFLIQLISMQLWRLWFISLYICTRIPFSFSTWSADHCVMTTLNRSISDEDCNIESVIVLLLFTNHQDHSWSKLIVLAWEWWRMVGVTMKGIIIIKSPSTWWQKVSKWIHSSMLFVSSNSIVDRYLWSLCFQSKR